MLAQRLSKRMRHLARWARKQGIGCFRLYERDIPDYPLVIDWFTDVDGEDRARDGDAVAWIHERTKDETPEAAETFRAHVEAEILEGLHLPPERLHLKHRGRQRGEEGGRAQYERVGARGLVKVVEEHGARFEVNLSDYVDVGLFIDHRPTRRAVRDRSTGKHVLNLFAYTGAFTVHARLGGAARTTTVDMSRTYLDWFERNLALNDLALNADHATVHADCLQWLESGPGTSRGYDIVICDPPTFTNSKRMKVESFAIERDYPQLLALVAPFVAPGGELFFSTNARRFVFDPRHVPAGFGVQEITHRSIPDDVRNKKIHRCWRFAEGWTPRSHSE